MTTNADYGAALTDDEAREVLGEGIHTALRKGCEGGHAAWEAINDLPADAWSDALDYVVWGLGVMGIALMRVPPNDGSRS